MLGIKKRMIFEKPCYNLKNITNCIPMANKYTTLPELAQQFIWDYATLEQYLKRKKVNSVFYSEECSWWDYIFLKEEVEKATAVLSNKLSDFKDRTNTILLLGYELFKAAQMEGYYIMNGSSRKPYYLKNDIIAIQKLYKEFQEINEVKKYRHLEIIKQSLL